MAKKEVADKRRDALRVKLWPEEIAWRGAGSDDGETGWFSAPRSLPLVLTMMREKDISKGKGDLSRVYLELLSRQRGQGVVEMDAPDVHGYACGYQRERGRTWLELMAVLEKAGFIRTKSGNGRRYDTVFIVHPAVVVQRLADAGRIREDLFNTYLKRQVEMGERAYEEIVGVEEEPRKKRNVVPLKPSRAARRK